MERRPLRNADAVDYPERKPTTFRVAGRWVRRVGVALAASAAVWVSGCLPIGIGGDVAAPSYFVCSSSSPSSGSVSGLAVPGSYGGYCSSPRAWGEINVSAQETVAIGLSETRHCEVYADVIDPDGVAVATIEANAEEDLELTLSPGRWLIAVDNGVECSDLSFDLHLNLVEE